MTRSLTYARRGLVAAWLVLAGLVLVLVLTAHTANPLGYRLVIIRGGSMSPTIPLGAIAFEQAVTPAALHEGDVVTLTLPQGTIVTHRIIRLADQDGQLMLQTKGDANAEADATLEPASEVTGIVRFHVPLAGFAMAFLGLPSGIASLLSMLGSILLATWLIEDVLADSRTEPVPSRDFMGDGLPA